jgi:hypothetical protein
MFCAPSDINRTTGWQNQQEQFAELTGRAARVGFGPVLLSTTVFIS